MLPTLPATDPRAVPEFLCGAWTRAGHGPARRRIATGEADDA
jgi:hypothetical protein